MNNIKLLRIQHKLNQQQLSTQLNVSQGTLSNWERGEYDIDNQSLAKLADLFNVSTDYILGRAHHPNVEYIPADPEKVAAHEAEMEKQRMGNLKDMHTALGGIIGEDNPEDTELAEILQAAKDRPDVRALFSMSKDASPEDVQNTMKVIKALRGSNDEFNHSE